MAQSFDSDPCAETAGAINPQAAHPEVTLIIRRSTGYMAPQKLGQKVKEPKCQARVGQVYVYMYAYTHVYMYTYMYIQYT